MSGPNEQIKHHADRARKLATEAEQSDQPIELAALSAAHGLAAVATALGEGFLSAEVELVKFAGDSPIADGSVGPIPMKPVPRIPAPNELDFGDRVLCVQTEDHVWPDVLAGEPKVYKGMIVPSATQDEDLYRVEIEVSDGKGPTVQLHREQLRVQ